MVPCSAASDATTEHELQLQSFDGKLHLLDAGEYTLVRQEKASFMPPLKATPPQRQALLAYLSGLGGIAAGPVSGPVPRHPRPTWMQ